MSDTAAVNYSDHPWTFHLIGINAFIYLVIEVGFGMSVNTEVVTYGLFNPDFILAGQWWRLITSTLLHADFLHLLFNMVALLIFGSALERFAGPSLYLLVYFGGGVLANLMVLGLLELTGNSFSSLGASGSIMAVIGASFSCALYMYCKTKMSIWRQFFQRMAIILGLQLLLDVFLPQNSMLTHFAGGVSGIVLGGLIIVVKVKPSLITRKIH